MNHCSIIMVTYRPGAYDREQISRISIQSLLANTSYPFEFILIDNSQNNRGLGAARNLGISQATGRYIAIVDDDIEFQYGWLEACIDILDKFPGVLATPIHVDKNRPWWKKHYRGNIDGYNIHSRSGSNCMVMKKHTLELIGPFENIHPSKDGVLFHDNINFLDIPCMLTREPLARDLAFNKHSYKGIEQC